MSAPLLITVFMTVWGFFLLNGKGTFLLSGYNTMSEEKKKTFDDAAVAKWTSLFVFIIAFSNFIVFVGDYYGSQLVLYIGIALVFCSGIGLVLFMNRAKRIRKSSNDDIHHKE